MGEHITRFLQKSVASCDESDIGDLHDQIGKPDLRNLSDIQLMDCLRRGEQEALSYIFDRYHGLVLHIATRIVRDPAEAEDLMQEVFFAVYRAIDRFDPTKGTVKNWIVQFTYHKSLNRRKYLNLRGAFDDSRIKDSDLEESAHSPHRGNGHPAKEIIEVVERGLATLVPKQREIIELVCFQGFLLREVANHTNESFGNVRHHYYRGIEKLREFVNRNLQSGETGSAAAQGGGR